MERLLKAVGQTVTESKPILELNPDHVIIRKLREGVNEQQLRMDLSFIRTSVTG